MKAISAIVPVYNVDKYLHRCVTSILDQTYQDFELILIDDGSVDSSAMNCDYSLLSNSNIIVIHQKNQGLSSARNSGIELNRICSISSWITFIDSDDWINKRYFEYLLDTAQKYQVEVVASNYIRTDKYNNEEINNPEVFICSPEEFITYDRTAFSVSCCKLFNISCFDDIRFPVGKYHEDEYTTYKVLFKYNQIGRINNSLYYYYINPQSITKSKWDPRRLDVIDALKSQINFFYVNKYYNALHSTVNCYVWVLYEFSKDAQKGYPELSKKLKNELKTELKKYKKLFPNKEYGYLYYYVYPIRYQFYILIKRIKSKLFKTDF